jgi:hypothetical protein
MIIANVSHKFASANHEKIKEKILYCTDESLVTLSRHSHAHPTYKGLDVEEEHPNGVVVGLVQLEEVYSSVLWRGFSHSGF